MYINFGGEQLQIAVPLLLNLNLNYEKLQYKSNNFLNISNQITFYLKDNLVISPTYLLIIT